MPRHRSVRHRPKTLPAKLRPCCFQPDCIGYRRFTELLALWGLTSEIHGRGMSRHFSLVIPEFWSAYRRERFSVSIQEVCEQADGEHDAGG